MKELHAPIDKAGRVVLPKEIRDELAIEPGDIFDVSVHGDAVTLRPRKERAGFIRRKNALIFSTATSQMLESEATQMILDEIRGERVAQTALRLGSSKRARRTR